MTHDDEPPRRAPGLRDGEMARRLRSFDWSATALGPVEGWPEALALAAGICLDARLPMALWWGPGLVGLYNDAYAPILGARHPGAFGRPASEAWPELWPRLGPQLAATLAHGEALWSERVAVVTERNGYPEEAWFTVSLSPVPDGRGGIGGVLCACTEDTAGVVSDRRAAFLARLDDVVRPLTDPKEITLAAATLLGEHLKVDRCAYADIEADEDMMNLAGNYLAHEGVRSIVGRYPLSAFGEQALSLARRDLPYVVRDVATHEPAIPEAQREAYRATQIRAVISVPLHKSGRFVAGMAVHSMTPRAWRRDEVDLVLAVANRCWESIERARVDRVLRYGEERYRTLVDTLSSVVWWTDEAGAIVEENGSWQAFTGQTFEQCRGQGWLDAIHPDDRAGVSDAWVTAVRERRPYEAEYRLMRSDGEYRSVVARAAPVAGPDGAVREWIGSCADVTARRRAEQALREANGLLESLFEAERAALAESERVGRMKDEFLATLSHELRTPLHAISGWAQILRGPGVSPETTRQGVEVIHRNARAQAQLVGDLLDMSRIVGGQARLDVQDVDLSTVVAHALDGVEPTASAKGVRLDRDFDPGPVPVVGDPARLQQVFWNLLNNAVKFTPGGGAVRVTVRRVGSRAEVTVSDTGIGIPTAFLPRVFDRFAQADATTTRRFGGLGLGLSIVKQLVEMHSGAVSADSPGEGHGATFTVALPLSPSAG